jgi:hypothetical protein
MKEKNLIVPEFQVTLTKPEIEQILLDTHDHMGALLVHVENTQKHRVPDSWIRRRIVKLRNLIAKLEPLLEQDNENETRTTDTSGGHQPGKSG